MKGKVTISAKGDSRSYIVDALVILFGISSWVSLNGLWVELPILVQELPESWDLSSYIVVTSQLANLGPILYSLIRKFMPGKVPEVAVIHLTLAVGLIASVLLAAYWKSTTYVGNEEHSSALLILGFFLAFVDCTSSVLYLPFMVNLRETYVVSYIIGEGMSGLLPSLTALAQGVGGNQECRNVTIVNVTEFGNITMDKLVPYHPSPRFSVTVFFGILAFMVLSSWVAFYLLNVLPVAKRQWVYRPSSESVLPRPGTSQSFMASQEISSSSKSYSTDEAACSPKKFYTRSQSTIGKKKYISLLVAQTYICFLHNALLSIQSFSCAPYGNLPYHLAVTLSSMASPLACFFAMFLVIRSSTSVWIIIAFTSVWSGYVLSTALLSPFPPLVGEAAGSSLIVLSWIIVVGAMAFSKAVIASILRKEGGHSALFWCGVVTQIGSALAAFLTFGLVKFGDIFHAYHPC